MAPATSGVGVGFGFKIGGGGGAPSCGAIRRPGTVVDSGVGLGCEVCGEGDALGDWTVVRGRESGDCSARLAPETSSADTATIEKSTTAARRVPAILVKVLNFITTTNPL